MIPACLSVIPFQAVGDELAQLLPKSPGWKAALAAALGATLLWWWTRGPPMNILRKLILIVQLGRELSPSMTCSITHLMSAHTTSLLKHSLDHEGQNLNASVSSSFCNSLKSLLDAQMWRCPYIPCPQLIPEKPQSGLFG